MVKFTHLHTHTPEGSLLDGFMRIDKAIEKAKRLGMDALGVSDHGTMSSHKIFSEKMKEAGLHPVFGMEAYQTYDKRFKHADFEEVHYETDANGKYIFELRSEEDAQSDDWILVEDITPAKEKNKFIAASKEKGSLLYKMVEETLLPGEDMPGNKAGVTRRVNTLLKQYEEEGKYLYVKADTEQKRFFEWFPRIGHILLIARDNDGYQNLLKLNSIGFREGFYGKPRIDYSDMKKYGEGIFASTACFLEDAPVITTKGTKKIKDVKQEDIIITHKGNLSEVSFTTTREYSGNMNTIVTRGSTLNLVSTEDHKILTFKETKGQYSNEEYESRKRLREYFEEEMSEGGAKLKARQFLPYGKSVWREAKDVEVGDILLTAIDSKVEDKNFVNVSSFAKENVKKRLKKYILPIKNDLLELLGIYAAEGSFGNSFITFTVDSRDKDLIQFILETTQEYFGIDGNIYTKGKTNGIDIQFNSTELRNIFASWFGHTSFYKKMPEFIRHLNPKKQMHFIKGLFYCDGHSRIRGSLFGTRTPKTKNEISLSTTSKSMVFDVGHVFHRNNINPSVSEYAERTGSDGVHHKRNFSINIYGDTALELDDFIFGDSKEFENTTQYKVSRDWPLVIDGVKYMKQEVIRKEVSYYEGDVYCLNVEGDHSFNAFGLSVHNCLGSFSSQLILQGRYDEAKAEILKLTECFDQVYLEVQPSHQEEQDIVNQKLYEFSEELGLPLLATSDVHMVDKDELDLHAQITNIGKGGSKDSSHLDSDISVYDSAYMMTPDEMLAHGIPEVALQNAYNLSHQCQVDFLDDRTLKFPEYDIPEGETFDSQLRKEVNKGLFDFLLNNPEVEDYDEYHDRIDYELGVISQKGYAAYFLIVQDYMNWAKDQDIMTGPGRGSAAGSLISYLLEITKINPIKHDLFFERKKVALIKFCELLGSLSILKIYGNQQPSATVM